MPYLATLAGLFIVLTVHGKHRKEWLVLSVLMYLTYLNTLVFDHNANELYLIRSLLTSLSIMVLVGLRTKLGLYISSVLTLTLLSYLALAIDVSMGEHILIYDYYEGVIDALIMALLVGTYPTIRAGVNSVYTSITCRRSNI